MVDGVRTGLTGEVLPRTRATCGPGEAAAWWPGVSTRSGWLKRPGQEGTHLEMRWEGERGCGFYWRTQAEWKQGRVGAAPVREREGSSHEAGSGRLLRDRTGGRPSRVC